ncbi:hypothetical protein H0H92_003675 [Tricholoma furcatifolium]|nr:hypothetical protein H0H92_003675 [Tricholoma furcatifolium]
MPIALNPVDLAKDMGKEYVTSAGEEAAKNAGKQTTDYLQSQNGQEAIDDAKAEAEGLWAKYCGCFSSAG